MQISTITKSIVLIGSIYYVLEHPELFNSVIKHTKLTTTVCPCYKMNEKIHWLGE